MARDTKRKKKGVNGEDGASDAQQPSRKIAKKEMSRDDACDATGAEGDGAGRREGEGTEKTVGEGEREWRGNSLGRGIWYGGVKWVVARHWAPEEEGRKTNPEDDAAIAELMMVAGGEVLGTYFSRGRYRNGRGDDRRRARRPTCIRAQSPRTPRLFFPTPPIMTWQRLDLSGSAHRMASVVFSGERPKLGGKADAVADGSSEHRDAHGWTLRARAKS
ncbi:hypothetical protein C8R45DRAFT_923382 [Mycena sanguinolenta]|nr:hypothetical protein C8R45DRAFT_923382 [Mycena sanguinolenta]